MMEREHGVMPAIAHGPSTAFGHMHRLARRWRVLAMSGLLGIVAGVAYYGLSPRWYQAEILIVPKEKSMGGLGAMGAMLGELPFDVGGAAAMGNSDVERIAAILKSRSTTDAVIEKFKLIDRYDVSMIEQARVQLWSSCVTRVERKPKVIIVGCEDKEPAVARDMANYIGQVGDAGFRRIATSSASEERGFLEKRAREARQDLDKASVALRKFQEIHKIIDLPEQAKAVVSAMATLEGDLISKRVQLAYLSGFASTEEASASRLSRQIAILRKELARLEEQRAPAAVRGATKEEGSDLFPGAMNVPELRYELEALFREQKIRETVFLLLTERYESLRVDEARDLSTFVVFDHAALPTRPVRPRLRVVPIGMMVGLVLGFMLIALPPWWHDLKRRAAVERVS